MKYLTGFFSTVAILMFIGTILAGADQFSVNGYLIMIGSAAIAVVCSVIDDKMSGV